VKFKDDTESDSSKNKCCLHSKNIQWVG